jgi:hypothetical protein
MIIDEHSDLSTLMRLQGAFAGRMRLETGFSACFSEGLSVIELVWSEHEARVDILRKGRATVESLSHQAARTWACDVCEALLRPEHELGERSTTQYFGTLTWEGSDLRGGFSGGAAWETCDPDPEMIALIAAKKPELAERARQAYVIAFAMEELSARMSDTVGTNSCSAAQPAAAPDGAPSLPAVGRAPRG